MGGARAEVQVGIHLGSLVWSQTLGVGLVALGGVLLLGVRLSVGVLKGLGYFLFPFLITQASKD